jgi:hypothetical protein
MKQRSATAAGRESGGIPRPNNAASSTSSPSKLAVRTNSRLVVAATAAGRQEPLGRTLSAGGDGVGADQQKGGSGGGSNGLQVLDAGYKLLGGVGFSRGGGGGNGGGQRALVSDKLYPR